MTQTTSSVSREQLFLSRARITHGSRYSYDDFTYVNAKTKSTIICIVHGGFQQSPDKHLNSLYPCPSCLFDHKSSQRKGIKPAVDRWIKPDEYLDRLDLPEKYTIDMSGYIGLTKGEVILQCPIHGKSSYSPQALMSSQYKCALCGRQSAQKSKTKSYESFVLESNSIFSSKYIYPQNIEDFSRKTIVEILCSSHGPFNKKAQKHLAGQGCPTCGHEKGVLEGLYPGGYSENFFETYPERKHVPASLYYLKIGNVYKIGITSQTVPQRVKVLASSSKLDIEVLGVYSCDLITAYKMEQQILSYYLDKRVARRWSTELFSEDVLKGAVSSWDIIEA